MDSIAPKKRDFQRISLRMAKKEKALTFQDFSTKLLIFQHFSRLYSLYLTPKPLLPWIWGSGYIWWIRRGSNSLPPPCHGGALPGELRTHSAIFIIH